MTDITISDWFALAALILGLIGCCWWASRYGQ